MECVYVTRGDRHCKTPTFFKVRIQGAEPDGAGREGGRPVCARHIGNYVVRYLKYGHHTAVVKVAYE